jgi:hypothetical protein
MLPSLISATYAAAAVRQRFAMGRRLLAASAKEAEQPDSQPVSPRFAKFMESGFLQASNQLRDRILAAEWHGDGGGEQRAALAAVAAFEAACAAEGLIKGPGASGGVSYATLSKLYDAPEDLAVITVSTTTNFPT